MQKRQEPSAFFTNRTGEEKAEELHLINPGFVMAVHWCSSSSLWAAG
jgi:hypothetical protein